MQRESYIPCLHMREASGAKARAQVLRACVRCVLRVAWKRRDVAYKTKRSAGGRWAHSSK